MRRRGVRRAAAAAGCDLVFEFRRKTIGFHVFYPIEYYEKNRVTVKSKSCTSSCFVDGKQNARGSRETRDPPSRVKPVRPRRGRIPETKENAVRFRPRAFKGRRELISPKNSARKTSSARDAHTGSKHVLLIRLVCCQLRKRVRLFKKK